MPKVIYNHDYYGQGMSKSDMLKEMVGHVFVGVEKIGDEELHFELADGTKYIFYHDQNCCETVFIEDIVGDLEDLVGVPLLMADESTNTENPPGVVKEWQDEFLWTFYRFRTIKGSVDIRWYGDHNGYYSNEVDMRKEISDV